MIQSFKTSKIKAILLICSVFLLVFSMSGLVHADPVITVCINDQPLVTDVAPILHNNRVLVPMRAIFESFGATVAWNDHTKTVTGTKRGLELTLPVGKPKAFLNGQEHTLDVPAMIINGRTMVPARFVVEALGAEVAWNQEQLRVDILKEQEVAGTINLGANLELSGPVSPFSKSVLNGMELAVDYINHSGGVKGRLLALIKRDNASDLQKASSIAKDFANDSSITGFLGPVTSGATSQALSFAESSQKPLITPTATNPKVTQNAMTGQPFEYAFRICFLDSQQARAAAKFGLKYGKKAAVLYTRNDPYSQNLAVNFIKAFTELGGEIVYQYGYDPKSEDINRMMNITIQHSPNSIYLPGYYSDVAGVIAKKGDIKEPFIGSDGWDSKTLITLAGEKNLEGCYFTNHFAAKDGDPVISSFIERYKRKYGVEPDALSALGYDSVGIFAKALEKVDPNDGQALQKAILQMKDYQGITGKLSFDGKHDPTKEVGIVGYKDKKFQIVEWIRP